jgi:hypothetical protein
MDMDTMQAILLNRGTLRRVAMPTPLVLLLGTHLQDILLQVILLQAIRLQAILVHMIPMDHLLMQLVLWRLELQHWQVHMVFTRQVQLHMV